jgi:hypothetical protein
MPMTGACNKAGGVQLATMFCPVDRPNQSCTHSSTSIMKAWVLVVVPKLHVMALAPSAKLDGLLKVLSHLFGHHKVLLLASTTRQGLAVRE